MTAYHVITGLTGLYLPPRADKTKLLDDAEREELTDIVNEIEGLELGLLNGLSGLGEVLRVAAQHVGDEFETHSVFQVGWMVHEVSELLVGAKQVRADVEMHLKCHDLLVAARSGEEQP